MRFETDSRVLPFRHGIGKGPRVGTVHRDGSITYAGITYPSIRHVPPGCEALRVDVETYVQWKALYRAIDPRRPKR